MLLALSCFAQPTNVSVRSNDAQPRVVTVQPEPAAQTPTRAAPEPALPIPPAAPLTASERDLLLQQAKLIQAYDDKILRTVHFALAAVFSIAALLVGYGWFTNFKMAEKDRQRLKEETLNEANANALKMRYELDSRLQEAITSADDKALRLKQELSTMATSLSTSLEQRTIKFSSELVEQVSTHRREIDSALRDIIAKQLPELEARSTAAIEKGDARITQALKQSAEHTKTELLVVKVTLYRNLARQAANEQAWSGSATWHLKALEAGLGMGSDWFASEALKGIAVALNSKGLLTKTEKSRFTSCEQLIPESLKEQFASVKEAIEASADYKSPDNV